MKQYPSYKDSGVEWIGEIPSEWDIVRLKYVGKLYGGITGKSGDDFNNDERDNNKPFIPFTNISNNTFISIDNFGLVSIDRDERQNRVEQGDIFFLMSSETIEDVGKSSVLVDDVGELYLNSFCKGFRVHDKVMKPVFLNHLLSGDLFRKILGIEGRGFTRINLRQDKIYDLSIFHPPLQEQQQISKYLDRKTRQIDSLIKKTGQKVELLKEQRISLINQVVTKGLNPDVNMKNSGVEWIGDIPSEWRVSRLDFLCSINGRLGWKSLKADEYVDDGYIFLSTPNIKNKNIDFENVNYITEDRYLESPEIILEDKDILLVKDGSTLGIVNIVRSLPRSSTVNSSIAVLKNKSERLLPLFLFYHLTSNYSQNIINRIKGGMGVPHLFQADIKKFVILLPPTQEQQQIVDYLDKQTSKIDSLIEKETKRIELLKEYRLSLISKVVTGKVDVREEVVA